MLIVGKSEIRAIAREIFIPGITVFVGDAKHILCRLGNSHNLFRDLGSYFSYFGAFFAPVKLLALSILLLPTA
jgi:hypothetical protein